MVALEAELRAADVASIWELVEVGELGVSFANLCTQLYEYKLVIDPELSRTLAEVGAFLGFDSDLWRLLESQQTAVSLLRRVC